MRAYETAWASGEDTRWLAFPWLSRQYALTRSPEPGAPAAADAGSAFSVGSNDHEGMGTPDKDKAALQIIGRCLVSQIKARVTS